MLHNKTLGGFILTEREAAIRLDSVCYCYSSGSADHRNRMAKAIMDYIQAVQKNGLDNQPGYFNCGNLKKTFGIDFTDQPAVRYTKIATYRV